MLHRIAESGRGSAKLQLAPAPRPLELAPFQLQWHLSLGRLHNIGRPQCASSQSRRSTLPLSYSYPGRRWCLRYSTGEARRLRRDAATSGRCHRSLLRVCLFCLGINNMVVSVASSRPAEQRRLYTYRQCRRSTCSRCSAQSFLSSSPSGCAGCAMVKPR
jgi:hypothetical protein